MFPRSFRLAMVVAALVALAACQSRPPIQRLPPISFANEQPIALNVGQLEIKSEFQATGQLPHYEHLMPVSPEASAIQWAKDRLKPMGRSGYALVIIRNASVIRTPLQVDTGVTGLFKNQQSERYDGSLDVTVQILDERHLPVAEVTAHATQSQTIAEDANVNERDRALYGVTEHMIRDIDSQMNGLIGSYFSRWVIQQ
jgi:hypothetical protein